MVRLTLVSSFGVVCALLAVTDAAGQAAPTDSVTWPTMKRATAVRLQGAAPRIDGVLDDAVWAQAVPITDFVQKDPVQGAEPTERTELRILYDGEFLYVGARMFANDPAAIQRSVSRRDVDAGASEHLWISLDTYRDRRTAYSFGVTAAGARFDFFHPQDHEFAIDVTFDPVWEADAVVDSLGWTAEMRIPFSQLRFNRADEQVWGFNVDRWVPSRNEDIFWIPVPRNVTAWSSRMGELVGIRGIAPSRRLELLPYAASNATVRSEADPANPFNPRGRRAEVRAGVDLKMGLGPSLTLQGTVNPDFGQVETDPAVVNLSAFETFFEERRPFFTEQSNMFRAAGASFFYSRRIGAAPGGPAAGDYVDRPTAATILGAAKVTGRTRSGLSVGALTAVTAREYARTWDSASATESRAVVAPLTGYGVLRLQQELGRTASTVGAMLTMVQRDLSGIPSLADRPRQAVAGTLDWNWRMRGGLYELGGFLGFSHVTGDSTAIQRLQRSSARYFQRPDQSYVTYDPSATSLSGYVAGVFHNKTGGRHWLWNLQAVAESPGFEINDAGRIVTADGLGVSGTLTYRETRPGRLFRNYALSFNTGAEWNFGGERLFSTTRMDASLTFLNQRQLLLTGWVDHRGRDQRLTRGGPLAGTALSWVTITQYRSNFAARTTWSGRLYYGRNEFGGLTYRLSGGLTARPSTRWLVSASPNYLFQREKRQYITSLPSAAAVNTYGRRYVFATLDYNEWSVPLRFNYAFTPDLTLELYAQPFLASGKFYGHGELERAGGAALRVYGVAPGTSATRDPATGDVTVNDNGDVFTLTAIPGVTQDFSLASIRSNTVLRWEWRRGSTLYLVWQQNRGGSVFSGERVRVTDLFDGLSHEGDNFFAVKVAYWISGS
jgi:hypothetical protein